MKLGQHDDGQDKTKGMMRQKRVTKQTVKKTEQKAQTIPGTVPLRNDRSTKGAQNGEDETDDPNGWIGALAPWLGKVAQDPGVAKLVSSLANPTAVDTAAVTDTAADQTAADASIDLHRRTISAVEGIRPPLAAALAQHAPVILVVPSQRDGEEIVDDIRSWWSGDPEQIALMPSWETLPHERLSPRADTVAQRMAIFRRLAHPKGDSGQFGRIHILVLPVRSLIQPVSHGLGEVKPLVLSQGEETSMENVEHQLLVNSYEKVDLVTERGQFAVRGGLLDIFPPTAPHPVRVEFFGDEIDSIRAFHAADQRTFGDNIRSIWATPCREILLTQNVKDRAKSLIGKIQNADDMLAKISQGIPVEGMESLLPVLVDKLDHPADLLPKNGIVLLWDADRLSRAANDLIKTAQEFLAASWHVAADAAGTDAPLDFGKSSFLNIDDVISHLTDIGHQVWTLTSFSVSGQNGRDLRLDATAMPDMRGEEKRAVSEVRSLQTQHQTVIVTAAGKGALVRLHRAMNEAGITGLTWARSKAVHGFSDPAAGIALITESDVIGHASATGIGRHRVHRHRHAIDLLDLKPGDYIVHEQHGIGRFVKLEQRQVGSGAHRATKEYLVLEYAPTHRGAPPDKLYVPTDQMDLVSKYIGADKPKLNKLGGADWAATKNKAKKHVKEIATDLVRLYSARRRAKGFAFSPDTPWQREMEDNFPYQETPDQLRAIDDVKADMEKPVPMDRLISGDVGFGKTEIAVRAAFKAVMDGKQVAVLAPTTLLVQQHEETFTERYEGFPVTVRPLSRFQSKKEIADTLKGLADGTVDVVIGTHMLLNPKIKFHDLGLVIIDEEQRFGVEHKETLKALRNSVDVLSMSATPIPRTLEMAITGIRQMSQLTTPPEDRLPILTYVGPYEDAQVTAAIRRELLRGGQVFYVHNRVNDISKVADRIHKLVPEARLAIGHGKMNERQLDNVIRDFWQRKIDVLVCTTIIETGLDISNANTLIVDNADKYGLAQLHQLRGRVGRSKERAYAYFLYDPSRPMTEQAHQRLETIAQNTALGSGTDVALKDLELRGTGNLLGSEQSGHIEGVGFDLYVRMVSQAVEDYKNPGRKNEEPVTVDLPIQASIPVSYISSDKLRLEAYRQISADSDKKERDETRAELEDRYGKLPAEVENLFALARLREHARKAGITEISALGSRLRFARIDPPESVRMRMSRIYRGFVYRPVTHIVFVNAPFQNRDYAEDFSAQDIIDWVWKVIDDLTWKAVPPSQRGRQSKASSHNSMPDAVAGEPDHQQFRRSWHGTRPNLHVSHTIGRRRAA